MKWFNIQTKGGNAAALLPIEVITRVSRRLSKGATVLALERGSKLIRLVSKNVKQDVKQASEGTEKDNTAVPADSPALLTFRDDCLLTKTTQNVDTVVWTRSSSQKEVTETPIWMTPSQTGGWIKWLLLFQ